MSTVEATNAPAEARPATGRLFVVGLVLAPLALLAFSSWSRARKADPPLPVVRALTEFNLTERSGRRVGLGDLSGRVWICDFVFTRCAGPCPQMCMRMAELQKALAQRSDVRLVTFTLDPEFDTPEVLKTYADHWGADPERWWFLTGEQEVLHRLSREQFLLAAAMGEDPSHVAQGGGGVIHSDRLVLVDGQGRIRAYYRGTDADVVESVRRDVGRLLRESSP